MVTENVGTHIKSIFETVQTTTACHSKYATILKSLFERDNYEFLAELTKYLTVIVHSKYTDRNIYVDRSVSFVRIFSSILKPQYEDGVIIDNPILKHILTCFVKWSNLENDSVRFWSCQMINQILEISDEISEDFYKDIKEAMMDRLMDSKSAVVIQAIFALYRLQDPFDPGDPVIHLFCDMLNTNCFAKVRAIVTEKIALTKHSVSFILNRIRDVDDNVRLAAFKKISPAVKHLKISQRRLILQCGFLDTSQKIKTYIATVLVQDWSNSYDDDHLQLIKSLRIDACEDDIKKTVFLVECFLEKLFNGTSVKKMISTIGLNQQKMIEYDRLNWDTALYYRILIQHLAKSETLNEFLNLIQPELIHFCRFIKGYCELVKTQDVNLLEYYFVLQQLFLTTQTYDISDPVSRQCLNSLVCYVLQSEELPADVTEVVVNNLERTIPNVALRSTFVCEIISNILYGESAGDDEDLRKQEIERKEQISQLKAHISLLRQKEQEYVSEKRFTDAQQMRVDIDKQLELLKLLEDEAGNTDHAEEKTDVPTILKYLNVAEALLRSPTVKDLNPALETLSSKVILQLIVHENDEVKAKAFKCYSLCCIVNKKCARYGIHIFTAPILCKGGCPSEILLVCVKTVVDLLRLYGLSLVEKTNEEEFPDGSQRKVFIGGTGLEDVVQGLADLLDYEDPEIEEVVTMGVCQLLLCCRITSPSLVTRIVIKWADPATENSKLKQYIGFTLDSLPRLTSCRDYFADVIVSVIRTLVYAPKHSPLADVDHSCIINFMLTLCSTSPEGILIHGDVALKICSQMMDRPSSKINFDFAKTLLLLKLPENREVLNDLINLCDQLRDEIRQNHILRNITKFGTILKKAKDKLETIEE